MRYDVSSSPFNNLFDSFFTGRPYTAETWSTPANGWANFYVRPTEDGFNVQAELAGVKKEDLKIEVTGNLLKVSGSRGSKEAKDGQPDYSEFTKSFKLGDELDTDKIEANLENGFLNLKIPRAESRKPKFIEIK